MLLAPVLEADIDVSLVADAAEPFAIEFGAYVRAVATWLRDHGDT